jgi:hypothetical protein
LEQDFSSHYPAVQDNGENTTGCDAAAVSVPTLSLRGARAEAISCLTSRSTLVRQEIASARAPRNDKVWLGFPFTVQML